MTTKTVTIDPIKVQDALFHIQEMLERSQIPFFALGSTAKHIYKLDPTLEGDEEVNIGVKKSELTKSQMSTLKSLIPTLDVSEFQLSYTHNDIPVIIDVIHTDYKVFKYPDTKWFALEFFQIPNPFSEYWQQREFIK